MIEQHFLDDCLFQLRKLKTQADAAMAQVEDVQFFSLLDPDANSIALIVKHVAGNMRSRWTNFLTTDCEKPDRDRDSEFDRDASDTRQTIMARWDAGWDLLFMTIISLGPEDLGRTVPIRGEPHTAVQAINRQLSHYSAHVGQIVLLAKHYAGPNWKTLSIPKRK
ncbi:MAG: DUF1572 family protein [Vicinamibacterales bacterium]